MFRNLAKKISNKSYLLKPFPSAQFISQNYSIKKLSENINEKLYGVYFVGTIPSGLFTGAYMVNKVIEENIDKPVLETYVKASTIGICGVATGIVLWLTMPITGPIIFGSYLYNNKSKVIQVNENM
jgi:hypothetical protein